MSNEQSSIQTTQTGGEARERLVVVDANALLHRSYHALPTMTSPEGEVIQGAYGFFSTFLKMIKELEPNYVAACFDLPAPTFRHKKFAGYKAQRPETPADLVSQIPVVKDLLGAFGVPVLEKEGFEADDIIGTIAQKTKDDDQLEVVILTGDLDTLQLVSNNTKVYTMKRGMSDTVIYGPAEVRGRYGFEPGKLDDYRGLKGDSSDNIPGVSGVGKKTATKILTRYNSVEDLYEDLEDEQKRKKVVQESDLSERIVEKLLEQKEEAIFSKKLATIKKNAPVDFNLEETRWPTFDYQKVREKFYKLGFKSLVSRLPVSKKKREEQSPNSNFVETSEFVRQISGAERVFGFLSKEGDLRFILEGKKRGQIRFSDLGKGQKKKLEKSLKDNQIELVGFDLKKCFYKLASRGVDIRGINYGFDLKVASYLVRPGESEYKLAELREVYSQDVFKLIETLKKKLEKKGQADLFFQIELPLVEVLFELEQEGVRVQEDKIKKLKDEVEEELAETENRIYELAGGKFNLNSPQQLSQVLFERLKLSSLNVKKTKEGHISTAASELKKLKGEHEIIDYIFNYRQLEKLRSTYLQPIWELSKKKNRIHPQFNQTATATGRLSCSEPNLQNIPLGGKRAKKLRDAFWAGPGNFLVSFDYSQVELRVAASLSEDKNMIKAFNKGKDIHTLTAARVFSVPYEKVSSDLRNKAKALNFGVIYGISPYGFARRAEVSRAQAKQFMDKYFERFPAVKEYLEGLKETAHRQGYVETIQGRRRYLPEIDSEDKRVQAQAERMAVNHPIQGSAADIIKIAMIKIHDWIKNSERKQSLRMILQIHDELIFEVKKETLEEVVPEIRRKMKNASDLQVPLVVDVKAGERWGSLKKM